MAVWSIVKVSELANAKRLDAEYYKSKYLDTFLALRKFNSFPLREVVATLYRYPTFYNLEYQNSGVLVLKGEDIENSGLVDSKHENHISKDVSLRFPKTVVKQGDLVLSVRGYVGKVGLIDSVLAGSQISPNLIRLEANASVISPYFIWLFLNTSFGQLQLERAKMQTSQETILSDDIKAILIPSFGKEEQRRLESAVKHAVEQFRRSKSLYLQAEQMLLEELAWGKLDISQPKWYTITLSWAQEVHRLDAEHFQPKYNNLIAHLKKTGRAKPLGEIATYTKRGLQPDYVEDGEIIVVNSQHLGRYLLNVKATERTDRQFWQENKRSRLQENDVLLYSTGAYIGRTNVWLEDRKGIASNHVTIIRLTGTCNPLYLSVFLNSVIGLLQTEKWASGSGQREIYPMDIERFLIYLPSEKFQWQIADLALQSYQAHKKAKALLEEAKAKVEALIKEGAIK